MRLRGSFGPQARFDQLSDRLGAAWDAVLVAEVVDPLEEFSAHGNDDARRGLVFGWHGGNCVRAFTGSKCAEYAEYAVHILRIFAEVKCLTRFALWRPGSSSRRCDRISPIFAASTLRQVDT